MRGWQWGAWLSALVVGAFANVSESSTQDVNLVDIISTYPELSTFIHYLQRARLIPSLNRMQEKSDVSSGMTIFAPTNAAFESFWRHGDLGNKSVSEQEQHLPDNIQAELRQQLLYHVLNYTLLDGNDANLFLETLHFPSRKRLFEPTRPGTVPQKPQDPPHPGAEDSGGLLGGYGQMLRVVRAENGSITHVGMDHRGMHGARVIHVDRRSRHGIVYLIDRVISLPPSLDVFLREQSVSTLFRHIPNDTLRTLATTAHLTVFLPTDAAWHQLDPLEKKYLLGSSPEALQDRLRVFGWHASSTGLGDGRVAYASELLAAPQTNLTTILGGDVHVRTQAGPTPDSPRSLSLDGMSIVQQDILTENGVVHIVDGMHMPFGDLGMTTEKYLLALNATEFVALMKHAGLGDYITQDPHEARRPATPRGPFTFLVPPNSALRNWVHQHVAQPISKHSSSMQRLRDMLLYHILPDHQRTLTNETLLTTQLFPTGLLGAPQRIPVILSDNKTLTLGHARVTHGPVHAHTATMYLLSDIARVPTDPVHTAARASLSTYVQALSKAHLDSSIRKAPLMTYLAPINEAFENMGLAAKYLLHTSNADLSHVIASFALPGALYMSSLEANWTRVVTGDGSPVWLRRVEAGIAVRTPTTGATLMQTTQTDLITDTGVVHAVSDVQLPPSVPMTLSKLARGAPTQKMLSLIHAAGFDWVWNLSLTIQADRKCKQQKLIVLLPEDRAFAKLNISVYEANPESLRALVALHILVMDECHSRKRTDEHLPLPLFDEMVHSTMLDKRLGGSSAFGRLAFRRTSASSKSQLGYMVGIKGARSTVGKEHAANVLDLGHAVLHETLADGHVVPGGVLTIDTVLEPFEPGWLLRWNWTWKVCLLLVLVSGACVTRAYTRHRRWGYTRVQSDAFEGEEE